MHLSRTDGRTTEVSRPFPAAAAARLRHDAEHAAELAALTARGDALLRRSEAAERAVEETRAAAKVARRELEERLDEATSAAASADQRHAVAAEAAVHAAKEETRAAQETVWAREAEAAAAAQREAAARKELAESRAETATVRAQLAAANERAHDAARALAEARAASEGVAAVEARRQALEEKAAALEARCEEAESRLAAAIDLGAAAAAARDEVTAELAEAREALRQRASVREDVAALALALETKREAPKNRRERGRESGVAPSSRQREGGADPGREGREAKARAEEGDEPVAARRGEEADDRREEEEEEEAVDDFEEDDEDTLRASSMSIDLPSIGSSFPNTPSATPGARERQPNNQRAASGGAGSRREGEAAGESSLGASESSVEAAYRAQVEELISQNERLRGSIAVMRTEMEALQRSMLASPRQATSPGGDSVHQSRHSTPSSTPRVLSGSVPPTPPSVAVSPIVPGWGGERHRESRRTPARESAQTTIVPFPPQQEQQEQKRQRQVAASFDGEIQARASNEASETTKWMAEELERARAEVRKLSSDKARLLEMSNSLRAELEYTLTGGDNDESDGDESDDVSVDDPEDGDAHRYTTSIRNAAAPASPLQRERRRLRGPPAWSTASERTGGDDGPESSVYLTGGLGVSGHRPPVNANRGGSGVTGVMGVKTSDRSTASQRARLKSAQRRANEKRAVRNWNPRDGDEEEAAREGTVNPTAT